MWQRYKGSPAFWDGQVRCLGGSFYQSFGWGEMRRVNGWQPLRLFAKIGDSVVAAASVLVKRKFGVAVCWVPGGPAGSVLQLDHRFRQVLMKELATCFIYCRIALLDENHEDTSQFLKEQNWVHPKFSLSSGLTMLYDLNDVEPARLKRLSGNWRHNLKRSHRYGLKIDHWVSPDVGEMSMLYREMEALKSLPIQHSEADLIALLSSLGDNIIVYRCRNAEGKLIAFRAAGIYGSTAIDLLAASGQVARKMYASHATLWALLGYCENLGIRSYDLSGVDPLGNKGVYDFKKGTGASLVHRLGEREWASVPGLSLMVNFLVARKFS